MLDTVVEHMPATLILKEAQEQRYILVNRAGEELLGLSRYEMIGKNVDELFPRERLGDFLSQSDFVVVTAPRTPEMQQVFSTRAGTAFLSQQTAPGPSVAG